MSLFCAVYSYRSPSSVKTFCVFVLGLLSLSLYEYYFKSYNVSFLLHFYQNNSIIEGLFAYSQIFLFVYRASSVQMAWVVQDDLASFNSEMHRCLQQEEPSLSA